MNKLDIMEMIANTFISTIFKVVKHEHPYIDSESTLLHHVSYLLREAYEIYTHTISEGNTHDDALCQVREMLNTLCPSPI